jgi:hypothetical protein
MGLESPAAAAWRVLSARVGGGVVQTAGKQRFGWPASQPMGMYGVPGPVAQPILHVDGTGVSAGGA